MSKDLWVTIDYPDDVLGAQRHYTEADFDAMMAYAASLGVVCVQWIYEPLFRFYGEESPSGIDPMGVACAAAHRHGMRFVAIFKPFEGARAGNAAVLPTGLPLPDDAPVLQEKEGLIYEFRPFVAAHPETSIARMEGQAEDPGGAITEIRLVKNDGAPSPFSDGDLSLWTSARNGGYARYDGPVSLSDSLEWRPLFPWQDRPYRVVTLGDLQLPGDTQFIMIRRERDGAPFTNAVEWLIELGNEHDQTIPATPALRPIDGELIYKNFKLNVELGISPLARTPAAKEILADRDGFLKLCQGMRRLNDAGWEDVTLEQGSEIVVMRGKERRRIGASHPIYKEARQNWLDHLRICLDLGADAINIRTASHNKVYEPRYFGFNEPVVEQMAHPGNFAEARRLNGDAYTQFLREAAELAHSRGKEMGVHVHGLMLHHDDRAANNSMVPDTFEWQWETWLKEIADFVEYRGAFFFRPENHHDVADRIGFVAREAGIPLVYQSFRGKPMHFDGPYHALEWEMDWVRQHPDVAAYNLYEMANMSRIDDQGDFEGSADIAKLVSRF